MPPNQADTAVVAPLWWQREAGVLGDYTVPIGLISCGVQRCSLGGDERMLRAQNDFEVRKQLTR